MNARPARVGAALTQEAARKFVIVEVWREDECLRNDPDAPRVRTEWDRFAGRRHYTRRKDPICVLDDGDSFTRFYAHESWVELADFNGRAIGLAIEVDELEQARRVVAAQRAQIDPHDLAHLCR